MQQVQIYLRGNFAEGNFGDDALLIANALLAERHNVAISVWGDRSPYGDSRFKLATISTDRLCPPGIIQYGGGTQFFTLPTASNEAQRSHSSIIKRFARAVAQPHRLVTSITARLQNRRIATLASCAIGLGVGPFTTEDGENKANVIALLRRMNFIWLRDLDSIKFCAEHGIENTVLSADLCFTEPFSIFIKADKSTLRAQSVIRIGIILCEHQRLDRAFHEKMFALARTMRSDGIAVDFLSFSPVNDRFVQFYRAQGESVIAWNSSSQTLERFNALLKGYTALLTARFHGGIFSVINETPFTVISINDKLASLATRYKKARIQSVLPEAALDTYLFALRSQLERIQETKIALSGLVDEERALARTGEDAYGRFLMALREKRAKSRSSII